MSLDPSEVIRNHSTMLRFDAQEAFLICINVENCLIHFTLYVSVSYFVQNC